MGQDIGKNISKSLSGKYSQKLLGHAIKSATDAFKTSSKRIIQKTAEATDVKNTGNKIDSEITKTQANSQENNLEIVKNDHDKEIPKERYASLEERQ